MPRKFLKLKTISEEYDIDVATLRDWIYRGKIKGATKPGRDWLIPVAEIDRLLNIATYVPYVTKSRRNL
jgi:predicted site-specific integrase-resolvase